MSTTIIQSFGGNVGIGTDTVGDSVLSVNKTTSNVGALSVTSLTVAGVSNADVPEGLIIMWYDVGNIPTGWLLCDGANGTPDLRASFPRGITTGSPLTVVRTKQTDSNLALGTNGNINSFPQHKHQVTTTTAHQHKHNCQGTSGAHSHNNTSDAPHNHPNTNQNAPHQHQASGTSHSHNFQSSINHTHDVDINDTRFAAFSGGYPYEQVFGSWTAHGPVHSNDDPGINANYVGPHNHNTNQTDSHTHPMGQYNTNHTHTLSQGGSHDHQDSGNAVNVNGTAHGNQHSHTANAGGSHDHQVGVSQNTNESSSAIPQYRLVCFIMKGPAS